MKQIAEFKIKKFTDPLFTTWEERPVVVAIAIDGGCEADRIANGIGQATDDACEVRWNWQGSPQGHYISIRS